MLELETDKATIEVPSSVSGTVQDVKVKVGDKVKVGQVVFTLERRRRGGAGEAGREEGSDKGGGGREGAGGRRGRHPRRKPTETQPKPQPAGAAEEGGAQPGGHARSQGRTEDDEPPPATGTSDGPRAKSTPI